MSESIVTNINNFYLKLDLEYSDFIKQKLEKAEAIRELVPVLKNKFHNLKAKDKHVRVEGELGLATWDYIVALNDFKYLNNQRKPDIYYLNYQKLDLVFDTIKNDKRVVFFNKLGMLILIDLFYELRIKIAILNEDSMGKKNNQVFKKIKEAIIYKHDVSNPISEDETKKKPKEKEYRLLNEVMTNSVKKVNEVIDQEVNINDISGLLQDVFTGTKRNVREFELFIFPLFYSHIILNKGIQDGTIGNHDTIKGILLFDIFPIILSDQHFKKDSDFGNNKSGFYNYKRHRRIHYQR
ncbi:MAG: hypothetical protein IPI93_14295 [Sphingobacteriaceae bacterium]|nr:hypothetical protein [Sphingobacteriaceae bacterium]